MGDIQLREQGGNLAPLSVDAIKAQVNLIQHVMREVMIEGQHYGVVPGTDKPALLKAGAEKLNMTFHLRARYPEVILAELTNGHREIRTMCQLVSPNGEVIGEGWGSCSTMETKYRYRNTARKCPYCGKEAIIKGKEEYGGGWVCFKKKDGCGAKFAESDPAITGQQAGKVENPDIADTYNTVLKMSNKRALTAATLNATAASDIFTQDIEENDPGVEEPKHDNGKGRTLKPDAARQALLDRLFAISEYLTEDEKATIKRETPSLQNDALSRYVVAWEQRVHKAPVGAGVPDDQIPFKG
jgi:hypothetical protein